MEPSSCQEHDTKIRNALPLNPTAEEPPRTAAVCCFLSCRSGVLFSSKRKVYPSKDCTQEKALPLHPAAEAALSRGKKRRGVKRRRCLDLSVFEYRMKKFELRKKRGKSCLSTNIAGFQRTCSGFLTHVMPQIGSFA